jgi:hypothetical protein
LPFSLAGTEFFDAGSKLEKTKAVVDAAKLANGPELNRRTRSGRQWTP